MVAELYSNIEVMGLSVQAMPVFLYMKTMAQRYGYLIIYFIPSPANQTHLTVRIQ